MGMVRVKERGRASARKEAATKVAVMPEEELVVAVRS